MTYDPASGAETGRSDFSDQHLIDRAVNYGVAWHEGQLFGLANQITGLVIALALIAISVFGLTMWLKWRPPGGTGAPAGTSAGNRPAWFALIALLAVLLPLFGLSVLALLMLEPVHRLTRKALHPS